MWEELELKVCYLDKPYRQIDQDFLKLLDEIRENNVTSYTWNMLKQRFLQPMIYGCTPTKLYTHTVNVDAINAVELKKIQAEEHVFEMESKGSEGLAAIMKKVV